MSELNASSNGSAGAPAAKGPPRVFPPDYRTLRLVAELAAGSPRREVEFDVDGGAVTRAPRRRPPSNTRVQIPARTPGRMGAMKYVELQAQGAGAGFDVLAAGADAVFWSESAVEKFLLPYLASAAAWEAGRIVQQVQDAFYTPWSNAQVVALLHRSTFPANTPVRLDAMVGVVYVDAGGTLTELPLPAFLGQARRGREVAPVVPPVPMAAGSMPENPKFLPSYTALRGIAEWASSLRKKPMYFLYNVITGELGDPTATLPPVVDDLVVIPAFTPPRLSERLETTGLWLQPDSDHSAKDVAQIGDAAFWSTGALEKFLFPYYASAAGAAALDQLGKLHRAWEQGGVPANGPGEAGEATGESGADGMVVYSIIHLPKSNWVSESEPSVQAVNQLGVLYAEPVQNAGTPRVVPLREFLRLSR
ncbi:MAG TPA: hypothetical protein VK358_00870 [Longimicrobium sp.]|nr:hypothetical protein [Longimicrobium sp.]